MLSDKGGRVQITSGLLDSALLSGTASPDELHSLHGKSIHASTQSFGRYGGQALGASGKLCASRRKEVSLDEGADGLCES